MAALFWDVAWKIGIPFVMVCIALGAFYAGKIVTKAAYDGMVKAKDDAFTAMVAEKNEQITRERERSAEMFDLVKLNAGISDQILSRAQPKTGPRRS
jgi:hypothetical protein